MSFAETDPTQLRVGVSNLNNAVFVVPTDTPLPNELTEIATEGDLYDRLYPLAMPPEDGGQAVALLTGPEMVALGSVWRQLVKAKEVYVLTGLPGARADVVFTAAARGLGLRSLVWDDILEEVARRKRHLQSVADGKPWQLEQTAAPTHEPPMEQDDDDHS